MKFYRTSIRVIARQPDWIAVNVPGYDPKDEEIYLPMSAFPEAFRSKLERDYIFSADVNLDAKNKYDLVFQNWSFT